jgi:type I restriction enzyme S subunit
MNAERLLALYERVAEAQGAVPRLRRFVLDLAVRGKLVVQDPADEPASELLKRIAAEKARLVKAGEIRNKPDLSFVEPLDQPHSVPGNWKWVRFGNIVDFSAGRTPARNDTSFWNTGEYPWVSIADMEDGQVVESTKETVSEKACKVAFKSEPKPAGTMIMSFKLTIGKIARLGVPAFHNEAIISIRPHLGDLDPYLFKVLPDLARGGDTKGAIKGATLNRESISNILIPLPPLAEQRRIVGSVEELMALLERLEAARTAREASRDRLTSASLTRLTAPDTEPEAIPTHARFAIARLPALTARADQIKPLRQTILNLAVRGKLVEQDPADEPLPRIDRGPLSEMEAPFGIPAGWQWSRLRALGTLKGGGTPSKARDDFWNGNIPWVSPKDMKVEYIEAAQLRITDLAIAGSAVSLIEPESVLFVVRGMILAHSFPVAVSRVPLTINQDMKAITLAKPEMAEYVLRALKGLAPGMLRRVQRSSHGTCRIEGSDYGDFLIPLPPLAEQHRIVAKVDALMALCDRLEAALARADATRARLLETLLHEALAPADAANLAAA